MSDKTCPTCQGRGTVGMVQGRRKCWDCGGRGHVTPAMHARIIRETVEQRQRER